MSLIRSELNDRSLAAQNTWVRLPRVLLPMPSGSQGSRVSHVLESRSNSNNGWSDSYYPIFVPSGCSLEIWFGNEQKHTSMNNSEMASLPIDVTWHDGILPQRLCLNADTTHYLG